MLRCELQSYKGVAVNGLLLMPSGTWDLGFRLGNVDLDKKSSQVSWSHNVTQLQRHAFKYVG